MTFLGWHRWIGLFLGLFIAVQGLGGTLLLFRQPLNHLLHPDAYTPAAPALDANVDAVRARGCTITRIDLPDRATDPLFFQLSCSGDPFMATAGGGQVLRLAPLNDWPLEWLFQFHCRLAAGTTGEQAVGWMGVALLALCLTGLWMLLRAARRDGWRGLFCPGWPKASLRRWRDLHRAVGLYLVPVLALLSLTGIGMAWNPTVTAALPVTPRPSPQVAPRPDGALLPLSTFLNRAQGLAPSSIRLPGGHGRVVMVMQGRADSPDYEQFWYNGYDGTLLGTRRAGERAAADRFMDLLYPLHTGSLLGPVGTILILLAGLSLPCFLATGIFLWSRRRGPGTMPMLVSALSRDGTDVLLITLRHRFGLPLPCIGAGDHVDVHLPNGLVRQYSLCGRPGRRLSWQIAVRLSDVSAGGSAWIHTHLKPGAALRLGRPRAHFPLSSGNAPVLLLAGGIGITPLLSMAWCLWDRGRPFTLLVCARDRAARPLAAAIAATPLAPSVRWHDSATDGRIDLAALLTAQAPETHLYTCGPAAFMQAALDAARTSGWSPDRLHWEAFAPATASGPAFTILLNGKAIAVAAGESLLDRLLGEGIALPHSCRRGLCGQCVVTVRSGSVDHRDSILTPEDRAAGRMTACCSRAADAGGELHLSLTP
ncbi:2Fe-2S iron-sulfur cluster binding domain-containing protein [Niveispirillum sp. SYP-B3756]|uniref:PepSY domain-containing protein n=1 Tax=Niveispirillum sp. SYP-B3756 TaxID=2662178 RepID=UPI001291E0C7|nr:PepSY domain-containing protein [Niveispirillum sp. SYP-B3756]MQP66454.1 2Fe-2S iron-sulfur cluster binding domain-containing protein [Niveispirillum sp. SYP-B3756]